MPSECVLARGSTLTGWRLWNTASAGIVSWGHGRVKGVKGNGCTFASSQCETMGQKRANSCEFTENESIWLGLSL